MTQTVSELALYKTSFFSYTVDLQGSTYELRFQINDRQNRYHFGLYKLSGEPLMTGMALVPDTTIQVVGTAIQLGLNGYFYLEPVGWGINWSEISAINISDYYRFFYVNEE